jgi:hypothetical protein
MRVINAKYNTTNCRYYAIARDRVGQTHTLHVVELRRAAAPPIALEVADERISETLAIYDNLTDGEQYKTALGAARKVLNMAANNKAQRRAS